MVHDDLQPGRELLGLGRPVPDHGRGSDHEGGVAAGGGDEVRQDRGGLAQAHVEGEAAAEAGGVEEPQPRQRLGLVAAEVALEALGVLGRGEGGGGRLLHEVGGPARALDGDAAGEGRAVEAERLAQHLGAGHLGLLGPLGQRLGGGGQVGVVEGDPAATGGPHQRAGLLGQAGDVGGGELDVVEDGGPAHVGELVGTDDAVATDVGEHAQRRGGLLAGEGGHPDVEAGVGEHRAGVGHEVPRLDLAEHDLAAAEAARPLQRREEALEAHEVALELPALVARR